MARLRFFFDHGAGGCLWAGDAATRDSLGPGPVDAGVFDGEGLPVTLPRLELSDATRALRDRLEREHCTYLNPLYASDPSLWSAARCRRFNAAVDALVAMLRRELGPRFEIDDEQERYREDARLAAYLGENPNLAPLP
jgi:hypothetical protein